nr:hypothetical protein [Bacteroidota bacterium]
MKYPWFKDKFITREGRVIFLSFFLNSGEMSALLQQRQGSKNTSDIPNLKFKLQLYTYYCHREGAAFDNTGIKNEHLELLNETDKQKLLFGRHASRILNYLNDIPTYFDNEQYQFLKIEKM